MQKTRSTTKRRLVLLLLILALASFACQQDYSPPISHPGVEQPSPTGEVPPDVTAAVETEASTVPMADSTPTLTPSPAPPQDSPLSPTPTITVDPANMVVYQAQNGDTLAGIAGRFSVSPEEIVCQSEIPETGFLPINLTLYLPDRLGSIGPAEYLLPDGEVVYSPSSTDLDIDQFVKQAGGYLSTYEEYLFTRSYSGAEVVELVAQENSVNPRILLSLLQYQSGWVYGSPQDTVQLEYPLGYIQIDHKNLYKQLGWAARTLNKGYYGWRSGQLVYLTFPNGTRMRIAPTLNAGSAALQQFFAGLYNIEPWFDVFYQDESLLTLHETMFGDPWAREQAYGPLFPEDFRQPDFKLPFAPGHTWNFTGGPHEVWGDGSPFAALDFAPIGVQNCNKTSEWVTAVAPGLVVRSGNGMVILDLDGDGFEQTGWVIFYLHVASDSAAPTGAYLQTNDRIGHPSCERGSSSGTHVHIARKYNGEWIFAGKFIPFELSGWIGLEGKEAYKGTLIKNDEVVEANTISSFETRIQRPYDDY